MSEETRPDFLRLDGGGPKTAHLWQLLPSVLQGPFDRFWSNYDSVKQKPGDAWLQITFPQHSVLLTHYSLASSLKAPGCNPQPRAWTLFGVDGTRKVELSKELNSLAFREHKNNVKTFRVRGGQQFSSFRLEQTLNWCKPGDEGDGELRLNGIELYGELRKNTD